MNAPTGARVFLLEYSKCGSPATTYNVNDPQPSVRTAESPFVEVWARIGEEIQAFRREIRGLPVLPSATSEDLRRELGQLRSAEPLPLDRVVDAAIRLLRQGTVHVTSPRYFGLFVPSVLETGIVADALAAVYNPQLATWSHAPAASEMEQTVLRRFAGALGFEPEKTLTNFTTGGAEANLSAVLVALAHRFPDSAETGVAGMTPRPVIYLSGESHHSFVKIARMTGLGTRALRQVATTERLALDVDALDRQMRDDARDGLYPLMVVATAGTTSAGVIDPLPELAQVAERHAAWFHVDAAWGGAAILSPRLRPLLGGIERADSVTWDAHKWLSVPMGAGMFFCRHPEAVQRAFAVSTAYMPGPSGEHHDPYMTSAQWSRRAIGLKVFMSLAHLGDSGYAEIIERQAEMGHRLREHLRRAGWIIVNDTRLPVVCFTHEDVRSGRLTTDAILRRIYERGRVWISDVVLGGEARALRACITSYQTDESDLEVLLEELEDARRAANATV